MTVLEIVSHNQWHTLFIDIVGILGGIFTVASIIDHLVHSSIRFLIEKNNLGKLRWFMYMLLISNNPARHMKVESISLHNITWPSSSFKSTYNPNPCESED